MTLDRRSVSESTAARLSLYVRELAALEREGVPHVSSQALARRLDLGSAQIRRDLAMFGEVGVRGVRGVGYGVPALRRHLTSLLGLDCPRRVAIIGAGRLGTALADHPGFQSGRFVVAAVFDSDPSRVGSRTRWGLTVSPVSGLAADVLRLEIAIGVLTVPEDAAREAARICRDAGIRAIVNFTPARLILPADVLVQNVDLTSHLETLSFYLGGVFSPPANEQEEPWRRARSRSLPRRI